MSWTWLTVLIVSSPGVAPSIFDLGPKELVSWFVTTDQTPTPLTMATWTEFRRQWQPERVGRSGLGKLLGARVDN
jgi:hypothetical protein